MSGLGCPIPAMRLLALLATLTLALQARAAEFNWSSVFKEGLVTAEGKAVPIDSLKGKVVAVYFSAEWCPPCKAFTPKLVEFAEANKAKLAIVFVSSDRSPEAQSKYMTGYKMPWAATPHGSPAGQALGKEHGVRGIPTLLVFGKDGTLVSKNGRNLEELKGILAN
jgi:thiol-disulfide isomerase/thioredoxin